MCDHFIPSCGSTTFCLSIHLLVDIWAVATFSLLWIVLLWIFTCKFFLSIAFNSSRSIPSSGIAGSYGKSIFSFWKLPHCFYTAAVTFYIPTGSVQGFQYLHLLANTWIFSFLILTTGCQFFMICPFYLLVDIWVVSSLGRLWLKLFWAFLFMSLGNYTLFSPSKCPGVEWLSHGVDHGVGHGQAIFSSSLWGRQCHPCPANT